MPFEKAIEPAKPGTESIQAVSAARLPAESSIPSDQTRMKRVVNHKYIMHPKPPPPRVVAVP